jgi:hypothetical protein
MRDPADEPDRVPTPRWDVVKFVSKLISKLQDSRYEVAGSKPTAFRRWIALQKSISVLEAELEALAGLYEGLVSDGRLVSVPVAGGDGGEVVSNSKLSGGGTNDPSWEALKTYGDRQRSAVYRLLKVWDNALGLLAGVVPEFATCMKDALERRGGTGVGRYHSVLVRDLATVANSEFVTRVDRVNLIEHYLRGLLDRRPSDGEGDGPQKRTVNLDLGKDLFQRPPIVPFNPRLGGVRVGFVRQTRSPSPATEGGGPEGDEGAERWAVPAAWFSEAGRPARTAEVVHTVCLEISPDEALSGKSEECREGLRTIREKVEASKIEHPLRDRVVANTLASICSELMEAADAAVFYSLVFDDGRSVAEPPPGAGGYARYLSTYKKLAFSVQKLLDDTFSPFYVLGIYFESCCKRDFSKLKGSFKKYVQSRHLGSEKAKSMDADDPNGRIDAPDVPLRSLSREEGGEAGSKGDPSLPSPPLDGEGEEGEGEYEADRDLPPPGKEGGDPPPTPPTEPSGPASSASAEAKGRYTYPKRALASLSMSLDGLYSDSHVFPEVPKGPGATDGRERAADLAEAVESEMMISLGPQDKVLRDLVRFAKHRKAISEALLDRCLDAERRRLVYKVGYASRGGDLFGRCAKEIRAANRDISVAQEVVMSYFSTPEGNLSRPSLERCIECATEMRMKMWRFAIHYRTMAFFYRPLFEGSPESYVVYQSLRYTDYDLRTTVYSCNMMCAVRRGPAPEAAGGSAALRRQSERHGLPDLREAAARAIYAMRRTADRYAHGTHHLLRDEAALSSYPYCYAADYFATPPRDDDDPAVGPSAEERAEARADPLVLERAAALRTYLALQRKTAAARRAKAKAVGTLFAAVLGYYLEHVLGLRSDPRVPAARAGDAPWKAEGWRLRVLETLRNLMSFGPFEAMEISRSNASALFDVRSPYASGLPSRVAEELDGAEAVFSTVERARLFLGSVAAANKEARYDALATDLRYAREIVPSVDPRGPDGEPLETLRAAYGRTYVDGVLLHGGTRSRVSRRAVLLAKVLASLAESKRALDRTYGPALTRLRRIVGNSSIFLGLPSEEDELPREGSAVRGRHVRGVGHVWWSHLPGARGGGNGPEAAGGRGPADVAVEATASAGSPETDEAAEGPTVALVGGNFWTNHRRVRRQCEVMKTKAEAEGYRKGYADGVRDGPAGGEEGGGATSEPERFFRRYEWYENNVCRVQARLFFPLSDSPTTREGDVDVEPGRVSRYYDALGDSPQFIDRFNGIGSQPSPSSSDPEGAGGEDDPASRSKAEAEAASGTFCKTVLWTKLRRPRYAPYWSTFDRCFKTWMKMYEWGAVRLMVLKNGTFEERLLVDGSFESLGLSGRVFANERKYPHPANMYYVGCLYRKMLDKTRFPYGCREYALRRMDARARAAVNNAYMNFLGGADFLKYLSRSIALYDWCATNLEPYAFILMTEVDRKQGSIAKTRPSAVALQSYKAPTRSDDKDDGGDGGDGEAEGEGGRLSERTPSEGETTEGDPKVGTGEVDAFLGDADVGTARPSSIGSAFGRSKTTTIEDDRGLTTITTTTNDPKVGRLLEGEGGHERILNAVLGGGPRAIDDPSPSSSVRPEKEERWKAIYEAYDDGVAAPAHPPSSDGLASPVPSGGSSDAAPGGDAARFVYEEKLSKLAKAYEKLSALRDGEAAFYFGPSFNAVAPVVLAVGGEGPSVPRSFLEDLLVSSAVVSFECKAAAKKAQRELDGAPRPTQDDPIAPVGARAVPTPLPASSLDPESGSTSGGDDDVTYYDFGSEVVRSMTVLPRGEEGEEPLRETPDVPLAVGASLGRGLVGTRGPKEEALDAMASGIENALASRIDAVARKYVRDGKAFGDRGPFRKRIRERLGELCSLEGGGLDAFTGRFAERWCATVVLDPDVAGGSWYDPRSLFFLNLPALRAALGGDVGSEEGAGGHVVVVSSEFVSAGSRGKRHGGDLLTGAQDAPVARSDVLLPIPSGMGLCALPDVVAEPARALVIASGERRPGFREREYDVSRVVDGEPSEKLKVTLDPYRPFAGAWRGIEGAGPDDVVRLAVGGLVDEECVVRLDYSRRPPGCDPSKATFVHPAKIVCREEIFLTFGEKGAPREGEGAMPKRSGDFCATQRVYEALRARKASSLCVNILIALMMPRSMGVASAYDYNK